MYRYTSLWDVGRDLRPRSIVVCGIKKLPPFIVRVSADGRAHWKMWLIGLRESGATAENTGSRKTRKWLGEFANITFTATAFCAEAYSFGFPKLVIKKAVMLEYLGNYSILTAPEVQITGVFDVVVPVHSGWIRLCSHPSRKQVVLAYFEESDRGMTSMTGNYDMVRVREAISDYNPDWALKRIIKIVREDRHKNPRFGFIVMREELVRIIIRLEKTVRDLKESWGYSDISIRSSYECALIDGAIAIHKHVNFSAFAGDVASTRTMFDLRMHMISIRNQCDLRKIWESMDSEEAWDKDVETFARCVIALDACTN